MICDCNFCDNKFVRQSNSLTLKWLSSKENCVGLVI